MNELRYLRAFRAVCDAGSLRGAARSIHRTDQAVSYQLRKLEEALGMPLFDRGNGPLVPNAAGQRLLVFCREMGRDWTRLHAEMHRHSSPAPLRIASVSGFGRYELMPLFRAGPLAEVPIRMHFPAADDVLRQVESGACDLGFVHLLLPHERLALVPVAVEEIALVAPASTPAPALDAATLGVVPYVTYDESNYVFASWFTQVLGAMPARLESVAHFEELEEVLDWVAAGRGLSVVPRACAQEHERRGDVVALPTRRGACLNTIYAVLDPHNPHPAIELTLEKLRDRRSTATHA